MGMRTTGGREVWYQLGSFDSESRAAEAAASSYWSNQGLQNVSVVPYYRVDSVSPSRSVESVENANRGARTAEGKVTHTAV